MPKLIKKAGFTLIELLVVMVIIATLLTLAVPKYFGHIDRAKESVLKENLSTIRETIDKFYNDTGKYPATLDDLITKKYLRKIPLDPITDSNETWVIMPPPDPLTGSVYDVHSGSTEKAKDGTAYNEW